MHTDDTCFSKKCLDFLNMTYGRITPQQKSCSNKSRAALSRCAVRREDTPAPSFEVNDSTTQQGSVLVAVLAIILLITFMVTRFMNEAMEDLEYRAIFNEPANVRSYAYSMLEVALATVQEVALIDDGKLYAGEQGWNDPIRYAEIEVPENWEVKIEVRDESGKLPINTISESLLNRLLEEGLDFDFGTSRELSSILLDWIDVGDERRLNGAESDDYLSKSPPYQAANRPLQSLEELRLLEVWKDEFFDEDGMPNEKFKELSGLVSVLNTDSVNLNAAPGPVLDILSRENGWQQDSLFDGLEQPYMKNAPTSSNDNSGVEVSLLRITVHLMRGEIPFVISVLVKPDFRSGNANGLASKNRPGQPSDDQLKTGSVDEQNALMLPFKIVQLSEYHQSDLETQTGRHSALDIGRKNTFL